MQTIVVVLVAVTVVDLLLKAVLDRVLKTRAVRLGPFGSLRMVAARMWLNRLGGNVHPAAVWLLWAAIACLLVAVSAWVPASAVFVGLTLGGSLSNTLESWWRGRVSDYVCLRFWPAFNMADLALTAGAAGVMFEVLSAVRGTLS